MKSDNMKRPDPRADTRKKDLKKYVAKQPAKARGPFSGFYNNETVLAFIFLALTLICFLPSLGNDFILTWDDNSYITDNPLIKSLSLQAIAQMFTSQVGGTYVPLPLLSFAIEYKIWGMNPLPFHLTNLVLHLLCTLLVFRIVRMLRLNLIYAAAAALIYGIHPMGVESVAWATERKDLLYCTFYFLSLMLYIYYVKSEEHDTNLYCLSLGMFILALFSKIQAVSLPLVLLLVDYYFNRSGQKRILLEKLPFFILSLIFGIAGIFVLNSVGALKVNALFTLTERLFFGMYTLSAYFLKFVVPSTLSAFYPYPVSSGNTLPVVYYLSPLFVVLTAAVVYLAARKNRVVVFGMLFFLVSVFFMLQIFGAGQGFLADRYVKVPYLGLVFIAGWGMEQAWEKMRRGRALFLIIFIAYSLFLMNRTYLRCKDWNNGETLWSDVIVKYPERDARPYACRGIFYRAEQDNDKALADFNMALALDPDDSEIMLMRGNVFFDQGKDESAYRDYLKVLKIKMENALALGNLGAIFVRRNQPDSAVYYLTRSVQMDSTVAVTFANRAVAYGRVGKIGESIADFKRYLVLNPGDERVCMSIAMAYQQSGQYLQSLEWFDKAIVQKPGFGSYYFYRSQSYKMLGNKDKALADAIKARDLGVQVPANYLNTLQ